MNSPRKGAVNTVLMIAVVVIALVAGYFAFQNSSVPNEDREINNLTKDWKTYRDDKFGFEVKYPLSRESNPNEAYPKDSSGYSIGIVANALHVDPEYDNIDNLALGQTKHKLGPPFGENPEISKLVVDGQEARLITPTDPSFKRFGLIVRYPKPRVIGDYGNQYELIELSIFQKDGSEIEMIKTIKFLDETDETANWRTYRNKEYGFEIKYPSDIFNDVTVAKTIPSRGSNPLLFLESKDVSYGNLPPIYESDGKTILVPEPSLMIDGSYLNVYASKDAQIPPKNLANWKSYISNVFSQGTGKSSLEELNNNSLHIEYFGKGGKTLLANGTWVENWEYNTNIYSYSEKTGVETQVIFGSRSSKKENQTKFKPIFEKMFSTFKFIQ